MGINRLGLQSNNDNNTNSTELGALVNSYSQNIKFSITGKRWLGHTSQAYKVLYETNLLVRGYKLAVHSSKYWKGQWARSHTFLFRNASLWSFSGFHTLCKSATKDIPSVQSMYGLAYTSSAKIQWCTWLIVPEPIPRERPWAFIVSTKVICPVYSVTRGNVFAERKLYLGPLEVSLPPITTDHIYEVYLVSLCEHWLLY